MISLFRRHSIAIALVAAVVLLTTVVFAFYRAGRSPISVNYVSEIGAGSPARLAAVQIVNRSSEMIYFESNQKVQFRIENHWDEQQRLPELDRCFLVPKKERGLLVILPAHANACRLLLVYSLNAPNLWATEYLTRHGWYRRCPKLCDWLVARLPRSPGKRFTAPVVKFPPDTLGKV